MKTKYDVLKQQEEITDKLWEDQYSHCISPSMDGKKYDAGKRFIEHNHICDFQIICGSDREWALNTKKWRVKEFFRKLFHRPDKEWSQHYQCEKYLDSIGKKQDEYWSCCDQCIHMRYVTYAEEPFGLIYNISTLGLDDEYRNEHNCGLWDIESLRVDIHNNTRFVKHNKEA